MISIYTGCEEHANVGGSSFIFMSVLLYLYEFDHLGVGGVVCDEEPHTVVSDLDGGGAIHVDGQVSDSCLPGEDEDLKQ